MKILIKSLSLSLVIIIALLNNNCTKNNIGGKDSAHVINAEYALRNKYKVTISLSKKIYREYEPVMLKIELINTDTAKVDFWDGFDERGKIGLRVFNDKGKYLKNMRGFVIDVIYTRPFLSVEPKETLMVSAQINDWGERIEYCNQENSDIYFYHAYFPKGKYYVRVESLKMARAFSNYESFEVISNTEEEMHILDLIKKENYEEIITNYPVTTYSEHTEARYLTRKWKSKVYYNEFQEKEEILNNYTFFFRKYPTSYYLLDDNFMYAYFKTITPDSSRVGVVLDSLNNVYKDTYIHNFLRNKYRVKLILNKNYRQYPYE